MRLDPRNFVMELLLSREFCNYMHEQKLKQKDINIHCMSKARTIKKLENKMHGHQKSGNDNEEGLSNRTVEKDIIF